MPYLTLLYFGCCLQKTNRISIIQISGICEQVNDVERGAKRLLSEKGHSALVVSFARHPDGVALVSDQREFKRLLPPTFKPKTPNLVLCSRGRFFGLILLPAFQCVCMLCLQMGRRLYKFSGTLF